MKSKEELRIVYMGTPDFAVESLRALVEGGYNVVGVVTMPDKPKGRHMSELQASPVKQYALSQGIPVLQPEKLKDDDFIKALKGWEPDLQVVVAFRMLPEIVWNMPPLGTFNLHASLLPQYRGAAPINWAVINGEKETGVTTFFLTHEIDTGKIILQKKLPIAETNNVEDVHDALMKIGAGVVLETVDLILTGKVNAISQEQFYKDNSQLKPAPKIFKESCRINWDQPIKNIYNFIRGLSPYPAAWTELISEDRKALSLKIYKADMIYQNHIYPVRSIITDNKTYVDIAAPDGYIRLKSIQPAGKKRMNVTDFLNGNKNIRKYSVR